MTDTPSPADPVAPAAARALAEVRSLLTCVVVLGFLGAYALNWCRDDAKALDLMNGALISAFSTAIGYWLGSSRSSEAKNATIATLAAKGR